MGSSCTHTTSSMAAPNCECAVDQNMKALSLNVLVAGRVLTDLKVPAAFDDPECRFRNVDGLD